MTLEPLHVTCVKLEPLLEEVTGQEMVIPDERKMHNCTIGSAASSVRMTLANPTPSAQTRPQGTLLGSIEDIYSITTLPTRECEFVAVESTVTQGEE